MPSIGLRICIRQPTRFSVPFGVLVIGISQAQILTTSKSRSEPMYFQAPPPLAAPSYSLDRLRRYEHTLWGQVAQFCSRSTTSTAASRRREDPRKEDRSGTEGTSRAEAARQVISLADVSSHREPRLSQP
jgi:hypothetical protein